MDNKNNINFDLKSEEDIKNIEKVCKEAFEVNK